MEICKTLKLGQALPLRFLQLHPDYHNHKCLGYAQVNHIASQAIIFEFNFISHLIVSTAHQCNLFVIIMRMPT